jgi:hypothetical protein
MHVWKNLPQHRHVRSMTYWLETVTAVGVRLRPTTALRSRRSAPTTRLAWPPGPTAFMHAAHEYEARIVQALARAVVAAVLD